MEKPSVNWKNYLHEHQTFNKAAKAALDLYINKYSHKSNLRETQEKVDDRFFIPGKIYSFLYTTKATPTKDRPFINRRPVFLSMGQLESNGTTYEVGIDLMLVPFQVRPHILDSVHKYFKKELEENESNINEGRAGKKAFKLTYESAKKVFYKLGWQMAFQTYDKQKIAATAIYDYKDWVSIIPLYTKGIEGKQPATIYEEYIKQITNPKDPVTELSQNSKET